MRRLAIIAGLMLLAAVSTRSEAAAVGDQLQCSNGSWSPTNPPTSYTYQFFQDGGAAPGTVSGNTYTVASGDAGHSITCKTTGINTNGSTQSAASNAIVVPYTGSCSQSTTFIARTAGENNAALNTLICGLVTDGLIDSTASMASTGGNPYCGSASPLDRLFVFAMTNQANTLLDVCGHASATASSAATSAWTTNIGYQGTDGSTTVYINTNYNPTTAGNHYSLTSAHFSTYQMNNAMSTLSASNKSIGHDDGVTYSALIPWSSTGNSIQCGLNTAGATFNFAGVSTSKGHYVCNYSSASAAQIYANGTSLVLTAGSTSTAVPNSNAYILAYNQNGTANAGGPWQLSFATMGGALTANQVANPTGSTTTGTGLTPRLCQYLVAKGQTC